MSDQNETSKDATQEEPVNEPAPDIAISEQPPTEQVTQPEAETSLEIKEAEQSPSEKILEKIEEVQIEQIGNKTIEKRSDGVTITEVMSPAETSPMSDIGQNTFPAPFKSKDLWQNFLDKIKVNKRKRLDKILEFLNKKKKITNNEVEKLLRVSDATATRYLDQLEKEGKITQVGKTGKYTYYEKIDKMNKL